MASRRIDVDPGPPPQGDGKPPTPEDEARLAAQREAVPPAPAIEPAGGAPEWEHAAVRALVVVPFLGLHWTVGRGGPPDIFIPDPTTRDELASTATAWLNQSTRLRSLARFGAGIAFAATAAGFVFTETVELRRYALAQQGGGRAAGDVDLPRGVTVRPASEWTPPPASSNGHDVDEVPSVRAWRPPSVPADTDPNK